jgi:hypothetical protein
MHGLLFISFSLAETCYSSQTNIYAQGVGPGASKGREPGKYAAADSYTGYVHMAEDAVSVFHFLHIRNERSGVLVLIYIGYR